jgi:hypothetical protein
VDPGALQHRHHELTGCPTLWEGKPINSCIKKLLACVHGRILWMDRLVPITVDLIAGITGIPTDGEKLKQYLEEKTRAKAISDEIKAKYGAE